MRRGLTLDYHVRIFGVRWPWRSLISEYEPPAGFRDEQLIGPYRIGDHRHRFWRDGDVTVIEDLVAYDPPGGPLGALLNRLALRRQLREIFDFRRRAIAARREG